jgi:hypothetical protein
MQAVTKRVKMTKKKTAINKITSMDLSIKIRRVRIGGLKSPHQKMTQVEAP